MVCYNELNDKGDPIMQRTSLRPHSVALVLTLALSAGSAMAQQQQATSAPPPTGPQNPPGLQRIEPGSDVPTTTIPARRGTEITETRANGVTSQVEVTTPGGSHYYVKPNAQPGGPMGATSPPQWKLGEFDLTGKRHAKSDAGQNAPTPADVPPPPPMPATAESGRK
jgi:hypothetical protein